MFSLYILFSVQQPLKSTSLRSKTEKFRKCVCTRKGTSCSIFTVILYIMCRDMNNEKKNGIKKTIRYR